MDTTGILGMPFQVTFQLLKSSVPLPLSVIGAVVWCMPVPPKKVHVLSMFGNSDPLIGPLWLLLADCVVPMTIPLNDSIPVFSAGIVVHPEVYAGGLSFQPAEQLHSNSML